MFFDQQLETEWNLVSIQNERPEIYFINTEFEWIKFLPAMLKIYYVPCFIFTFLNIKKIYTPLFIYTLLTFLLT